MRVALDATPLILSRGGLARYAGELSVALAENFPEDDVVLLSDQAFSRPQSASANLRCGGKPRNWMERRWWLCGVSREMSRQASAVFHGTNFEVPYLPLRPSVMTVLDLSVWMDPSWHSAAGRVRRRTPPLIGMGIATMLITPTEAVRRQAVDHFRVASDRVSAVPLGASEIFRPVETAASTQPYFLYAGALEPRKNLPVVLAAWRALRATCSVDLVLVGRRRAGYPEIPPKPGLRIAGEVSDEELARLYSGALALVYPSCYEGFGLPVLEAMQCGACVFISNDAALREVAGDAGVVLDGAREWAEAMRAAVGNPEWVLRQRKKSLDRARQFSWARTAKMTREVYTEAVAQFRF